jgi:hypothetical protein
MATTTPSAALVPAAPVFTATERLACICDDGVMAYQHDEQARQEAADHPIRNAEASRLREQCGRTIDWLGDEGIRAHAVNYSIAAWEEPPGLPDSVPRAARITRGDVMDIGEAVRAGTRCATDLFAASFVWAWGTTGFGPRRYRDIRARAGEQLEPSLRRVLAEINMEPGAPDPIAGYAQLYGGYEYESRAATWQEPWARLHGFGPAFFTKLLYFCTPGALILDNRLANAVHSRSGLPYLVTAQGRSRAWTPYRYAVYLHWMRQTAEAVGVEPEILELTLFGPAPRPLRSRLMAF